MSQQLREKFSIWLAVIRPRTLPASVAPILLGLSFAISFRLELALPWTLLQTAVTILTVLCALFMQMGTNLVNDYFDATTGVDSVDRQGPMRATSTGLLLPAHVQRGYIFCFSLALVLGIALSLLSGGWFIFFLGLFCLLAAYFYTAGPFPLSHWGLGELTALIFFGPVAVGGTIYLLLPSPLFWGNSLLSALILGLAPGFWAATLMLVNNLRDYASDLAAGKKTVVVLGGLERGKQLFFLLLLLIHLYPFYLSSFFHRPSLIFALVPSPLFIADWKIIFTTSPGAHYNQVLAATSKYLFLYCFLLSWILLIDFF